MNSLFNEIFQHCLSNLGEGHSLPWLLPIKTNEKIFRTERVEEGLGWGNNFILFTLKKIEMELDIL